MAQRHKRMVPECIVKPDRVAQKRHPSGLPKIRPVVIRNSRGFSKVTIFPCPHAVGNISGILCLFVENREHLGDRSKKAFRWFVNAVGGQQWVHKGASIVGAAR